MNYESVILIKPDLSKSKIKEIIEKAEEKIKKIATITRKQELGRRRLAYEIQGDKESYYVVHQFTLKDGVKDKETKDIERFFRITDEIMKCIIVKE